MHAARQRGLVFTFLGGLVSAGLLALPYGMPVARFFACVGPILFCFGLAIVIHPGARPEAGPFDFSEWFDECSFATRALYRAAALLGLCIAGSVYFQDPWFADFFRFIGFDMEYDEYMMDPKGEAPRF